MIARMPVRPISALASDHPGVDPEKFAIGAPLKKVKVLSTHPADSYTLTAVDEKNSNLKILDPAKFWTGEKYLLVMFND